MLELTQKRTNRGNRFFRTSSVTAKTKNVWTKVPDLNLLKEQCVRDVRMDWRRWRELTPADQIAQMDEKFACSLDRIANDRQRIGEFGFDKDRIAILISVFDADKLLPTTLSEIVTQLRECNLNGEVFVVLNNGGGTTGLLSNSLGQFGFDRVFRGHTAPNQSNAEEHAPNEICIDSQALGDTKSIDLIWIDQHIDNQKNRGKVRALRDIYEFLYDQYMVGRYRPQYLLAMDAETRLRSRQFDRRTLKDNLQDFFSRSSRLKAIKSQFSAEQPSGLSEMISLSRGGEFFVGASNLLVPFDDSGEPVWDDSRVNPLVAGTALMHGHANLNFLPGGATLAKYDEGVAILREFTKYSGNRVEDITFSIAAHIFGRKNCTIRSVVHLNRSADITEAGGLTSGRDQMQRWLNGLEGAAQLAGTNLLTQISNRSLLFIIFWTLRSVIQGYEIFRGLRGIPFIFQYRDIVRTAKENPDRLIGGKAAW